MLRIHARLARLMVFVVAGLSLTGCPGATPPEGPHDGDASLRFTNVAGGEAHSLAVDQHGHGWAWGSNDLGEIGDGTTVYIRDVPTAVYMPADTVFVGVWGGMDLSLALDPEGSAWGWGSNGRGKLGGYPGDRSYVPVPVGMPSETRFTALSAGIAHGVALDQDGNAWAWGANAHGQIGDTTFGADRPVPTAVAMPSGITFTAIDAGYEHSLALDRNGNAWAWGDDSYGQVGDGTTGSVRAGPTAVVMPQGITFTAVSAGRNHSLALDQDGNAWAWGDNDYGQLGDTTFHNQRLVPTAVAMPPGLRFTAISAGSSYSLALDANGHAWGWGYNDLGQVGDGTDGRIRAAPTATVMPPGVTFASLDAGDAHALAIDRDGRAWGWGFNMEGQVGDGTSGTRRLVPVAVQMP